MIEANYDLPVNLGNPKEFTMLELAQKVKTMTASKSQIVYQTLPMDDPRQRLPDITRAEAYLGWSPTVELTEGLKSTVDYFTNLRRRNHE